MDVYKRTETDPDKENKLMVTTIGYQWGEYRGEGQDRGLGLRDTNYQV